MRSCSTHANLVFLRHVLLQRFGEQRRSAHRAHTANLDELEDLFSNQEQAIDKGSTSCDDSDACLQGRPLGCYAPTIQSIKAAISTYELQGGSANIFVNDDGFQLFNDEQRQERMDFYLRNGIGWVARPPHDKDGFKRAGKFKKASNMNFALNISCCMEDKLKRIERHFDWSASDEGEATEWALEQTLKEGGDIAFAAGNIRVGDYILIIDSDTRVPKDCLLDAVSELEQSPEVAILQFSSGVMQISHNYFENGITFFTNLIYTAIKYGVANGDVAPFVGHNAMLRWSAVQDVAFETDGVLKFWSESHVSEDFDMALRLQIKGYITRLAAWAGDGFKEGVSLTVCCSGRLYKLFF